MGTSVSTPMVDVETEVRAELDKVIQAERFILYEAVRKLCGTPKISAILGTDESTSEQVRNKALRLFAILVRLKKPKILCDLLDEGCLDDHFFGLSNDTPYSSRDLLETFPELESIREDFYRMQWDIPPRLSPDVHQQFPKGFYEDHFKRYGEFKKLPHVNGRVELATIPGELLGDSSKVQVVCKKSSPHRNKPFYQVLNEPEVMRSRSHPNILRLRASFEVPRSEDDDPLPQGNNDLYMILECAYRSNMKDWMRQRPTSKLPDPSWSDEGSRQLYLIEGMESLASALAYLHRPIDGFVVCHFDLKPSNILMFPPPGRPVWKIADFGHSKFIYLFHKPWRCRVHDATREYAPPEYYSDEKLNNPLARHGPAYDVFSLGCIFLELATLIEYGRTASNAVEDFESERRKNSQNYDDSSFQTNRNVVERQFAKLRRKRQLTAQTKGRNDSDSVAFERLLFVSEDMMRFNPIQRPDAFEVALRLFDIRLLDMGRTDSVETFKRRRQRRIAELIRRPIDVYDNRADNPLTKAEDLDLGDSMFIGALKAVGWSDVSRWQNYTNHPTTSDSMYHLPGLFPEKPPVQREDVLGKILAEFDAHHLRDKPRRLVLYGLGGVGKSQIAWNYANACRNGDQLGYTLSRPRVKHCFWINARGESSLKHDCSVICTMIRKKGYELEPHCDSSLKKLRSWLQDPESDPWLMVLDGLDEMDIAELLASQLIEPNHGHVLITTRNRKVSEAFDIPSHSAILVTELLYADGLKLLCHKAHRDDELCSGDQDQLRKLLELVGLRLPRVINEVGKYLEGGVEIDKVINRLEVDEDQSFINSLDPGDFGGLLDSLILKNFLAYRPPLEFEARLLLLCTCYDVIEDSFLVIEDDLLIQYVNQKDSLRDPIDERDCQRLTKALHTYCDYCLIEREEEKKTTSTDLVPIQERRRFKMHLTIRRRVLAYFDDNEGPDCLLREYDLMLQTLWAKYWRNQTAFHEERGAPTILDIQAYEERFGRHFEGFVRHINTIEGRKRKGDLRFQFSVTAIRAILLFCPPLMEQTRFDSAAHSRIAQVLKFARERGIHEEDATRGHHDVYVEVLLQSAKLYRLRHSGLKDKACLATALRYANEAYEYAQKYGSPLKVWHTMDDKCTMLLDAGKVEEASELIKYMEELAGKDPEIAVLPHNLDRHRGTLLFCQSKKPMNRQNLIDARNMYIKAINNVRQQTQSDTRQLLPKIMLRLARVDMEIPSTDTLEEAIEIFTAQLNSLKETHQDDGENPEFWLVKRQLARCWLRQTRTSDAEKACRQLLFAMKLKLGMRHRLTETVAALLRDTLHLARKWAERDQVVHQYKLSPVNEGRFHLGRWFPRPGSDVEGWPTEWVRAFDSIKDKDCFRHTSGISSE